MSKTKAQIEIKAGYITIGKQFVGFSLMQKRMSSTAVMLVFDDALTIYKKYTRIYPQLLVTLAENISKFCLND